MGIMPRPFCQGLSSEGTVNISNLRLETLDQTLISAPLSDFGAVLAQSFSRYFATIDNEVAYVMESRGYRNPTDTISETVRQFVSIRTEARRLRRQIQQRREVVFQTLGGLTGRLHVDVLEDMGINAVMLAELAGQVRGDLLDRLPPEDLILLERLADILPNILETERTMAHSDPPSYSFNVGTEVR